MNEKEPILCKTPGLNPHNYYRRTWNEQFMLEKPRNMTELKQFAMAEWPESLHIDMRDWWPIPAA